MRKLVEEGRSEKERRIEEELEGGANFENIFSEEEKYSEGQISSWLLLLLVGTLLKSTSLTVIMCFADMAPDSMEANEDDEEEDSA